MTGRSLATGLLAAVCFGFIAFGQPAQSDTLRDGSLDFDWEIGSWKTHLKVLRQTPAGPTWVVYDGTSVVKPIWNGRASMVELEADGPGGHIEAINLRLYNPQAHQWSLNFASSKSGVMSVPSIGAFQNGRGEFYDTETIDGRSVLVRGVWSDIKTGSAHFEQAISADGGKTWETNWIADDTRVTGR